MKSPHAIGSGILLVCTLAAHAAAQGVPVGEATKEQWKGAQKTFLAADELFDAKRYEEAITAYRASWQIVASPNTRLQIARSHRELGRLGEAYDEFDGALTDAERAAAEDPKYEAAAKAARTERDALRARIAMITLEVLSPPDGTELSVGGRSVALQALDRPIAVVPGAVKLVARIPGRPDVEQTVEVPAGGEAKARLDLSAPEELPRFAPVVTPPSPGEKTGPDTTTGAGSGRSSLRPYAYIAGGVGVVGLATFAAFGVMNNSKFGDLDDSCPDGRCAPGRQDDIDAGRRYQTIANVGLAVGVVGLGVGTTLFLLEPKREGPSAGVRLGPGRIDVSGRF